MRNTLGRLQSFFDQLTMYRLVFWYLAALLGAAFVLGLFKFIAVDPAALAFSTVVVLGVSYLTNLVFARIFGVTPNVESVYITGFIVALIMEPVSPGNPAGVGALVFAAAWSMASKYVVTFRRRHLFNPAALGVALPALLLNQPATWWVSGQSWLIPIVLIGGLLIVRKIRRFDLVLAFAAANLVATVLTGNLGDIPGTVQFALFDSPFFFFAFVMLTEPLTAPQQPLWRVVFGALVGVLAAPNIGIAGYYLSPETALLVGNLLTLAVSPKGRVVLTLQRIEKAAAGAYDYIFAPDRELAFAAGQYLEWTLPVRDPDNRGNRRYFTIASAPEAPTVRLGVKFSSNASAFKRELAQMTPEQTIVASQLAGSFTLPKRAETKLAFIAGGIGVTPFRAMIEQLTLSGSRRDIVLLYGARKSAELAYRDDIAAAEPNGVRALYFAEEPSAQDAAAGIYPGRISEDVIRQAVPDFDERLFYISGPMPMVRAQRRILRRMGVPARRIRTDYFPGLN